jgi:hypothetical protein
MRVVRARKIISSLVGEGGLPCHTKANLHAHNENDTRCAHLVTTEVQGLDKQLSPYVTSRFIMRLWAGMRYDRRSLRNK